MKTVALFVMLLLMIILNSEAKENPLKTKLEQIAQEKNWRIVYPDVAYEIYSNYIVEEKTIFNSKSKYLETLSILNCRDVVVSPNGKKIIFVATSLNISESRMFVLDIETKKIYVLFKDNALSEPKFDLRENRITFFNKSDKNNETNLWVYDFKGEIKKYKLDSDYVKNLCSLNNEEIVYSYHKKFEDIREIIVLNVITGQKYKLLSGRWVSVDPNSNKISYQDEKDGNYYLVDTDGKNKGLFLENKKQNIVDALVWSPDGKYVLYKDRGGFIDYFCNVYAMDVETKEKVKITKINRTSSLYWGVLDPRFEEGIDFKVVEENTNEKK